MHGRPHSETTKLKCRVATKRLWAMGAFSNRPSHSEETRIKIRNTLRRGEVSLCPLCGSEVYSSPSRKRKFCSQACNGKAHTGENSPVYTGYSDKRPYQHIKNAKYKKWRKAVFERDNYVCQDCNKRCVELNAHHIFSYLNYPELRYEIFNGITLCVKCHYLRHRKKRG